MEFLFLLKRMLLLGILLGNDGFVYSQAILEADGPGETYELINSVLAPGYDVVENPECVHPEFGRHVAEVWDADLNQYVFEFYIHVTPDNDRCIYFDRQRMEIKTYDASPANLIGVLGETVVYKWRFKVPIGFKPSSSFTHIHQIKAVGGSDDDPIFTITARKGSPNRIELIHNNTTKVATVSLSLFEGNWVEATEIIKIDSLNGTYSMTIKKVSDGTTLLSYSNSNLMTIRYNNSFIRPKWGIYRSLNTPSDLRDEAIRFNSFSIGEVAEQTITFNALPTKVFGDIDFSPGATVNSSLTVSYSSSNPTVASIVDGKIHIVGVGTSTITAMQEGDLYHFVATSVDQTLTVISATAIEQKSSGKFDFRLYPNPVEDFITLDYSLKEKTVVNFDLYNLQGERVKALICSKWCDEGSYCDSFDCSDLIAGVYLGRIAAGNSMSTLKIVLSK